MIKVNLLPGYILEGRRVKALLRVLVAALVLLAAGLAAYVWAPIPQSLSSRRRAAQDRLADATSRANEVRALENETQEVKARYADTEGWVTWVNDSDEVPRKWNRYFSILRKYLPSDVVVSGLSPPSGNLLTLSGYTGDLRGAARWYLNMLRCEMVTPGVNSVSFSTPTWGWPGGPPVGANPKMQQPVSITLALKPEYTNMLLVPAPPATAAGGGVIAAGGGGRMGGGGLRAGGLRAGAGGRAGGGRIRERGMPGEL